MNRPEATVETVWYTLTMRTRSGQIKMGRTLSIIVLVSLSLYSPFDDSYAAGDAVFNPRLSAALQKSLEQAKGILTTDNISASLYISDRCYWEGAAGATVQDPDIPVDADMIYGFGSITKTFVAGLVLQLVEEKKLTLDDPLGNWLPHYPKIDANITVRQLLNHGSGLSGYLGNKRYWREIKAHPGRVWLPEDTFKFERPPQDSGADILYYSNTNYLLLGMIIEAITGNSLAQELQSRITGPLQLDSTYLPIQDFDFERWSDSTKLSAARFSSTWAAGAIASTARDIAKWSHTLYSGNFLQPASLDAMLITEPRRISGRDIPMGLGVWKLEKDQKIAWGHGGKFKPFVSATFYIPELDLSVAHSFNWSDGAIQLLPFNHLVRTYLENRPHDISVCFDS